MKILSYIIPISLIFIMSCGNAGNELCNCEDDFSDLAIKPVEVDLAQIKENGTLRAITSYSSTSYFLYRGQPMGYEYELLKRLADHLNLDLKIIIANDLDSMLAALNRGEADIIAHGLTITSSRKEKVDFTEPHLTTRQVLVQRKPENWRQMKLHNIEAAMIRSPLDLIGKEVHVRTATAYYDRLININEEIGDEINITPIEGNLTTDEIIRKVADGEIKYTVSDKNIASVNQTYYPDLDIDTELSLPTRIAWAVRKTSPELLKNINEWIVDIKANPDYYAIYNRYFKNKKAVKRRVKSEFYSKAGGRISRFDELIQQHSAELGWDWRLLASQIYQESRFQPKAESWAGAKGLMQVLPTTAKDYNITNLNDPEKSLIAGVSYLKYLQEKWAVIPDSVQRIKFMLASYNVGPAHVDDARRLTEKYGKDPDVYDDNVEEYLLLKSKPTYYRDEVVKYGYCRGREPFQYVRQIFERYDHYEKFVQDKDDEHQLALKDA